MFSSLVKIVELVINATVNFNNFRNKKERKDTVLDLLRTFYLFKDCLSEGRALIEEAGADPIQTLRDMDEWKASEVVKSWDAALCRQGLRLRRLEGYVSGQNHLVVIDSRLKDDIDKVIGSKFDRVTTLHSIGASLLFASIFPISDTPEDVAELVLVASGCAGKRINMELINAEVEEFEKVLERFNQVIKNILSPDEIMQLSTQARKDTLT
ncbi:hypothetical protein [Thalassospira sp. A3_1]|uniref:hypothetical protein n=1 Tax=Thalassospira sp. A3_1 TaxID=2821088 RepID=UPI001ADC3507|nr:hypothetical protein [Thalassospira sp. A3_1]MBO9509634.1 hypothetical protein [Thalassospira sp. A3_1]